MTHHHSYYYRAHSENSCFATRRFSLGGVVSQFVNIAWNDTFTHLNTLRLCLGNSKLDVTVPDAKWTNTLPGTITTLSLLSCLHNPVEFVDYLNTERKIGTETSTPLPWLEKLELGGPNVPCPPIRSLPATVSCYHWNENVELRNFRDVPQSGGASTLQSIYVSSRHWPLDFPSGVPMLEYDLSNLSPSAVPGDFAFPLSSVVYNCPFAFHNGYTLPRTLISLCAQNVYAVEFFCSQLPELSVLTELQLGIRLLKSYQEIFFPSLPPTLRKLSCVVDKPVCEITPSLTTLALTASDMDVASLLKLPRSLLHLQLIATDFVYNTALPAPSAYRNDSNSEGTLLPPHLETLIFAGPRNMPTLNATLLPHLPKTLRYCELGLFRLPELPSDSLKSRLTRFFSSDDCDPYYESICEMMAQFPPGCTCSVRFEPNSHGKGPEYDRDAVRANLKNLEPCVRFTFPTM